MFNVLSIPKDPIVRKNGGSFTRASSSSNRVKSAGEMINRRWKSFTIFFQGFSRPAPSWTSFQTLTLSTLSREKAGLKGFPSMKRMECMVLLQMRRSTWLAVSHGAAEEGSGTKWRGERQSSSNGTIWEPQTMRKLPKTRKSPLKSRWDRRKSDS